MSKKHFLSLQVWVYLMCSYWKTSKKIFSKQILTIKYKQFWKQHEYSGLLKITRIIKLCFIFKSHYLLKLLVILILRSISRISGSSLFTVHVQLALSGLWHQQRRSDCVEHWWYIGSNVYWTSSWSHCCTSFQHAESLHCTTSLYLRLYQGI